MAAVAREESGRKMAAGMGSGARAGDVSARKPLEAESGAKDTQLGEILSLCRGPRRPGRKLGLWQWALAHSQRELPRWQGSEWEKRL